MKQRSLFSHIGTQSFTAYLFSVLRTCCSFFPTLLPLLWPYVLVIFIFMLFVVWNGSIVVGDKAHHTACLHFPQLLYFSVFAVVFASSQLVVSLQVGLGFLRTSRRPAWLATFALLVLSGLLAVHYFTYVAILTHWQLLMYCYSCSVILTLTCWLTTDTTHFTSGRTFSSDMKQ